MTAHATCARSAITNAFEVELELDLQTARNLHCDFQTTNQTSRVTMSYDGLELRLQDAKAPLQLPKGERKLKLQIFMDRSVLEVFANDTVCLTKTIKPFEGDAILRVQVDGGIAKVKRFQSWAMGSVWSSKE